MHLQDMFSRVVTHAPSPISILRLSAESYPTWLKNQPTPVQAWLAQSGFVAEAGNHALLPKADGTLSRVLSLLSKEPIIWQWAKLAESLPAAHDYAPEAIDASEMADAALGWMLAAYNFDRYRKNTRTTGRLALADFALEPVQQMFGSFALARDLINTPTNDMQPSHLAAAAENLAAEFHATCEVIVGDALLEQNYPTIHAVGRASSDAPRLIDLRWGEENHPRLTLVGKGVCFDTGGLNIKTGTGMGLMKKDMGGAAFALALAQMVMQRQLPVRLRVLIPAVENSISGNAFRPQDIIVTRAGISVEISNTDAEGRLILADALAEADSETPDLLMDFATLTGASRVALGPDIPSFFTANEDLAERVRHHSKAQREPLWQLPLWEDYATDLASKIADTDHAGGSYAGAIIAALFLQKFIKNSPSWLHVDMMAWNIKDRPGRPTGGEAQGLRAIYALLEERYGEKA